MKLSDFNYNLPKELVAQKPTSPRDHSRLLVLNRQTGKIEHKHFYDIVDYLQKGDVLVLNNTKVFPARLIGKRQDTGGKVEVFLLKVKTQKSKLFTGEPWEVLIGNRRKRVGQIIEFEKGLKCEIVRRIDESVWEVQFNKTGGQLGKLIDEIGQVPIPPYIKFPISLPAPRLRQAGNFQFTNKSKISHLRPSGYGGQANSKIQNALRRNYQTVFAKYRGSVAAPTAGFHFTKALINKLKKKGVRIEFVTLHVGFGTFEPVKTQDIREHKMHAEFAVLDSQTAKRLNQAKIEGRRIISVGTTSARTLEAFSVQGRLRINSRLPERRIEKWINTFIYPGYQFKFVDALITNFHLPKSTLLMLVTAFTKPRLIKKAYQTAIKKKYRFYSFGDAMFIV